MLPLPEVRGYINEQNVSPPIISLSHYGNIDTVKPLVQSLPKRPQFCKIHEGRTGQGVQI